MKTAQYAVDNRTTNDFIVVSFLNWTECLLFDGRKNGRDIPSPLSDLAVESITVDGDLTIIEV